MSVIINVVLTSSFYIVPNAGCPFETISDRVPQDLHWACHLCQVTELLVPLSCEEMIVFARGRFVPFACVCSYGFC